MTITSKLIRAAVAAALTGTFALQAQTITETTEPVTAGEVTIDPDANYRPLDRIVAVVNNDVITEFELQNRVRQVAVNLRRQNIELPPMPQLRAQVLDRLITEKAMQQRAREIGVRVDEQMVTASIEQIARNNKLTTDELRSRLREEGVAWSAFRSQIRDEITQQRLREREVDSKINIPESEVDAYLAEQAGFTGSDTMEYRVEHILLPLPADGIESEEGRKVKALAEDILERVRKGEDFAKLAAAYSKASDAMEGGDLGWRDSTRLPSVFWQAIKNNVKTGYSTLIEGDSSIHIIKLAGERDGVKAKLAGAPVEQTHVRHILMFASDLMPEAQVVRRLNDIKQRVQKGEADFATFARLNSADASATRGGDLGWLLPGDTVPEFEAAMKNLKPGEISDPVRSPFGYHLIQVVERRTQVADATRSRLAARQALREKKLAEAVATWQRELHDKAYVDIRRDNL